MFDSNITVVRSSSTRRRAYDDGGDDFVLPSMSRRTASLSSHVMEDADAIRHSSRRQDAHLLNDITARLCRLEFDNVKPGLEVAMQTGFRRHIYQTPRPPLSKELRNAIKKDHLRYPWDYTKDNLYRPPRWQDKSPKELLKERIEGDPYPLQDPFGLYRDRPKREVKAIDDGLSIREEYAKLSPRQILSKAFAKAYTKANQREPTEDIDDMLREFSRPLPRSHVVDYLPSTGDLLDFQICYQDGKGLDPETVKKIQSGKSDIAEFERMLDARQKARLRRPLVPAVQRPQDLDLGGIKAEHDFGLDDYYGLEDEMPAGRRIYPTRTVVTASHHAHSPSAALARRPPLPSTARVHPRAAKYMVDTVSDYRDPTPYVPAASMNNLRTRAAECRSKMDHQKVLLDRYLPVYMGPDNDVQYEVEAKYGELAARYPL